MKNELCLIDWLLCSSAKTLMKCSYMSKINEIRLYKKIRLLKDVGKKTISGGKKYTHGQKEMLA